MGRFQHCVVPIHLPARIHVRLRPGDAYLCMKARAVLLWRSSSLSIHCMEQHHTASNWLHSHWFGRGVVRCVCFDGTSVSRLVCVSFAIPSATSSSIVWWVGWVGTRSHVVCFVSFPSKTLVFVGTVRGSVCVLHCWSHHHVLPSFYHGPSIHPSIHPCILPSFQGDPRGANPPPGSWRVGSDPPICPTTHTTHTHPSPLDPPLRVESPSTLESIFSLSFLWGWLPLPKGEHERVVSLSLSLSLSHCVCVCVYSCVCERQRQTERGSSQEEGPTSTTTACPTLAIVILPPDHERYDTKEQKTKVRGRRVGRKRGTICLDPHRVVPKEMEPRIDRSTNHEETQGTAEDTTHVRDIPLRCEGKNRKRGT